MPPSIISPHLLFAKICCGGIFMPPSPIHEKLNKNRRTLWLWRTRGRLELTVPPYIESSYTYWPVIHQPRGRIIISNNYGFASCKSQLKNIIMNGPYIHSCRWQYTKPTYMECALTSVKESNQCREANRGWTSIKKPFQLSITCVDSKIKEVCVVHCVKGQM